MGNVEIKPLTKEYATEAADQFFATCPSGCKPDAFVQPEDSAVMQIYVEYCTVHRSSFLAVHSRKQRILGCQFNTIQKKENMNKPGRDFLPPAQSSAHFKAFLNGRKRLIDTYFTVLPDAVSVLVCEIVAASSEQLEDELLLRSSEKAKEATGGRIAVLSTSRKRTIRLTDLHGYTLIKTVQLPVQEDRLELDLLVKRIHATDL